MSKLIQLHLNLCFTSFLGAVIVAIVCGCFAGCGPADSIYHDGNFTEEQKSAAQAEYQTVDDEESQGSNKKKKTVKK
ncbi:MAG: hypothetical protein ACK56W_22440 [Pirellula sp.]|jgi:hypothetical protein|nr:hypothetical protein [Pirellula sp.]